MGLKHGYCNSFVSLRALTSQLGTNNAEFLALSGVAQACYSEIAIKTGSKVRILNVPEERLRRLQKQIDRRLLRLCPLPDYLHGGVKSRSHVTNAAVHAGAK